MNRRDLKYIYLLILTVTMVGFFFTGSFLVLLFPILGLLLFRIGGSNHA